MRPLKGISLAVIFVAVPAFFARSLVARRALWVERVDLLCACGAPTRSALELLARTAGGGLDRVARAELDGLHGACVDLHTALHARTWTDEARGRPLRVAITQGHRENQRALSGALGAMCDPELQGFWRRLQARVTHATSDPPELTRAAQEHLRVKTQMCLRSAALGAPPRGYVLTAGDADRAARCGH